MGAVGDPLPWSISEAGGMQGSATGSTAGTKQSESGTGGRRGREMIFGRSLLKSRARCCKARSKGRCMLEAGNN